MPTYEYECEKCGLRFERMQPITAAPLKHCPECHGRVHRVISGGAGFIMKGGGQDRSSRGRTDCSFQRTGRTCCGRERRCDTPSYGGEE